MKIRVFIIIVMLIAFYPFIGGNKGCGGAIQFGGDEGVELAGEEEPGESISIDTAVPGPEVEVAQGEAAEEVASGTENILKFKPEEPEDQEKVERRVPECATFLPANMDLYVVVDPRLGNEGRKSLEELGLLNRLEYLSRLSMNLLKAKDMPLDMTSVCGACRLSKDKIDKTDLNLLDCDEFAFVNVFSKDFKMIDVVAVDDAGNKIMDEKIRAYKPAERVLIVATASMQEDIFIDDEQKIPLGMASPSTFILMGKSAPIRTLRADPVIQLFMPMYLKAGFEFPAEIVSALDFNERVKMSSLMSEDQENRMKIYMELPYEEYAFEIKKISDEERASPLENAPTAPTIERERSLERAPTIEQPSNIQRAPSATTIERSSSIERSVEQPTVSEPPINIKTTNEVEAPRPTLERRSIERTNQ
ncbi:MAG: hypothetical protein ABH871_09060 [Pseudomonadota bacterium]